MKNREHAAEKRKLEIENTNVEAEKNIEAIIDQVKPEPRPENPEPEE